MKRLTKVLSVLLIATFMLSLLPAGSIVFSAGAATETTFEAMLARAQAMVEYEWTPTTNIPTWNGNTYNGLTYFPAGQTVKGMPYTLFSWELGFDSLLSLDQYKTKTNYGVYDTACSSTSNALRDGPAYGNCCATFVSEVFGGNYMNGSNPRYDGVTALKNSSYGTMTTGVKATAIQSGDALVATGVSHIVWVGETTSSTVTIYESTPPVAKKTVVSRSSVNSSGYLLHDGVAYSTVVRSNQFTASSTPEDTTADLSGIVATSVADFKAFVPITVYPCTGARFYAYLEDRTTQDGQIWPEDKCVINAIYDDGWCQVTYPTSSGDKTRYSQLSNFVADTNATPRAFTAAAQITAYTYSDLSTETGYLSVGDNCYTVASSGSATQVLYPITGGYKLAWVATSQLPTTPATYTVSYNANGGAGAPSAQTKTEGVALTLASTAPVRSGYTFKGWATSASATTATYQAGGQYTANASATLYAVWQANTYVVTYNANGGADAPAAQTKTHGVALTLSSTIPTRPNYTFKGWALTAGATTATYQPGAAFTTNANTTLYAVWEAATVDPTAPILEVANVSGMVGDTVEVTVTMKNNPGVYCFILLPEYDKTQLSLVSMTAGANMGGDFTPGNAGVWVGEWDNVYTDEVAMVLTFRILEGATGTSEVTVTYQEGDICDYDENEVNFFVVAGSVTVEEEPDYILGDANGDGNINTKDLTRLKKYLSDPDNIEALEAALDVNCDGSVNTKDLTRMKKHLSDPDNVTFG